MRIAWIGLGIMGSPMAENLLKAGHPVTGYTLEQHKLDRLAAAGGTPAASVADAVRDADVVVTMLPADPDVTAVAGEVLAHAAPGTLYIDMSTVSPATAAHLATASAAKGVRFLDAPVSGGEAGALEGTLSVMAGGPADDFRAAKPLFAALGTTVVHCGSAPGSGQTVKAANQLIVAVNLQACAEAVVFLRKSGVDLDAALDVLAGGLAGSTVLARKRHNFLDRTYAPGFRIDLHHKDMGIVTAAAREAGAALPVGGVVAGLVAALRAQGDGALDHSALLRGVERLSGIPTEECTCP
ncbi:2-hydroxy-3-oxopropionate reductase [Streptomyces morookaense]|uniref:2-hydroxy-3-oxopropionate reductase n=1 Tax=Streptomyces morookaense TaxID=1970 RepID=A0A7Y7E531_STRMO|nr:2-hydroxy-3-oxopropionate reductase [Streptomyces morookaense]NVK76245.1 2-hydroxy-3-oxopropionate reductase [Streptomyces morookaense]GHF38470.1 2-hydroxy-3-oxopropionate reductase [Streptomyces morookaense]